MNRSFYSAEICNFLKEPTNKIVFAFSVFDEKESYAIKAEHRKAINQLFTSYAKYKGFKEEPERLLDALTTQGRILTYEIPSITNDGKYFWD